jgi:hypothetical protein
MDYFIPLLADTTYYYFSDLGWIVTARGIAAYSISELEKNPKLLQVELCHHCMQGYYLGLYSYIGKKIEPTMVFSWNPTVRRKSDYQALGGKGFGYFVELEDRQKEFT